MTDTPTEKLQKVLASHGIGSRRAMERWIADGRIKVNGVVAGVGDRVAPSDQLTVDGRNLTKGPSEEPHRVIVYN